MGEVLVSVWCTTYNHELYIRDAMEGFLMQQTNFKYEILVHDDASTDKNAAIIREYEEHNPDIIRGIYQTENQYSKSDENKKYMFIYYQIVKNCRGKYVAVCEGDDYWIDPQKLQIQVDYMEEHPECVMTAHNEIVMDCKDFTVKPINVNRSNGLIQDSELITQRTVLQPSSKMFRLEALKLTDFLREFGIGDYPMSLHFLQKGTIYYFDRIMTVYRINSKGSWTESMMSCEESRFSFAVELIDLVEKYNHYTKKKYDRSCICQIQRVADSVIYSASGKDQDEFMKLCGQCKAALNEKYHIIIQKLIALYQKISDIGYLDAVTYEFTRKFPKLYIMGAGKYASIMSKKLESQGIVFEGFLVSDRQKKKKEYLGHPVWRLGDIDLRNAGVIIGINPVIWDEIISVLHEAGVGNYICPFLL